MPAVPGAYSFLELVLDYPEIWTECPVWRTRVGFEVVPFSEGCTPEAIDFPPEQWEAAKAFVAAYRNHSRGSRLEWARKHGRAGTNYSEGKKAVWKWAGDMWVKKLKIPQEVSKAMELHGWDAFTIMREMRYKEWQSAEAANVSRCEGVVAVALFGDEVRHPTIGALHFGIGKLLPKLIAIEWDRMGRLWRRAKDGLPELKKEVEKEWERLATLGDALTGPELAAWMKTVNRYCRLLTRFGDKESVAQAQLMKTRCMQLQLIARRQEGDTGTIPMALRRALERLADTPTVIHVLEQLDSALIILDGGDPEVLAAEPLGDAEEIEWESGVEEFQNTPLASLWADLGIKDGQIPGFNKVYDPDGNLDSRSPMWEEFCKTDRARPLEPRWHQVVGAYKMLKRVIAGESTLLLDGVGVGKTMQVVAVICLYIAFRRHFAVYGVFPGAFANCRCDTPDGNLPDLFHMIVVPPGLRVQWEKEIHRYVQYGVIDVIPYASNWDKTARKSLWDSVKALRGGQGLCNKVILATQPAIISDALHCFVGSLGGGIQRPERDPGTVRQEHTYLAHFFGVVAFDEVGACRNTSRFWTAARELSELGQGVIGMTATPIHNSPLDVLNIGLAIGIPGCGDEEYRVELKRELARAGREARKEFKELKSSGKYLDMVMASNASERNLPKKQKQLEVTHHYVRDVREKFSGAVIRRTIHSRDWEGKPISGLDAYYESVIILTPNQDEREAIRASAEELLEDKKLTTKISREDTGAFYGEFRRCQLHPKLRVDPGWIPKDESDWLNNSSTKLSALCTILDWHLEEDNRPPLKLSDDPNAPNQLVPKDDFEMAPRDPDAPPDRIIVFIKWPSNNPLIKSVLGFRNIEVVEVNGSKSVNSRATALDDFRTSTRDGKRVLLLSSVGMEGHNIAEANILIILDTLWSRQEDTQLIGRVWRLPQDKKVIVYRLIHKDSTDVLLNVICFTKLQLHEAFVNADEVTKKAFKELLPKSFNEDSSDEEDFDDEEGQDEPNDDPSGGSDDEPPRQSKRKAAAGGKGKAREVAPETSSRKRKASSKADEKAAEKAEQKRLKEAEKAKKKADKDAQREIQKAARAAEAERLRQVKKGQRAARQLRKEVGVVTPPPEASTSSRSQRPAYVDPSASDSGSPRTSPRSAPLPPPPQDRIPPPPREPVPPPPPEPMSPPPPEPVSPPPPEPVSPPPPEPVSPPPPQINDEGRDVDPDSGMRTSSPLSDIDARAPPVHDTRGSRQLSSPEGEAGLPGPSAPRKRRRGPPDNLTVIDRAAPGPSTVTHRSAADLLSNAERAAGGAARGRGGRGRGASRKSTRK